MKHYKMIVMICIYILMLSVGMYAIYEHIQISYRTFNIQVSLADMFLWCLYKGIYIVYVVPVILVLLYNTRLRRVKDIQMVVRGGSRLRIIIGQELYIIKISFINSAVSIVSMLVISYIKRISLYNFNSYNSMFAVITKQPVNINILTVYSVIFYYMFMQVLFVMNSVLLINCVTSSRVIMCLGISIIEVMEWMGTGLGVINSNCYKLLSDIQNGYWYMLRIIIVNIIVWVMTMLIYKNREYR